MLKHAANRKVLESSLAPRAAYAPFPRRTDRDAWTLAPEAHGYLVGKAEVFSAQPWPQLPATRYLDFYRDGNRSRFETPYFERRTRLATLTAAECAENKGRFVDAIIDGIWAICEESTWVVPAHNSHSIAVGARLQLPEPDLNPLYIDLFAAETAAQLAIAHFLLSDVLADGAPQVVKRMEMEITHRVLEPFLASDAMHWMGFVGERPVNNWNPWINSNIMIAFLLMEKDAEKRVDGIAKAAASTQNFLDVYGDDGGCDEGPSYFGVAGASLLDILELLYGATGGAVNLYNEPKIRHIAEFIYHAHIAGRYFMDYADAPAALDDISAGLLLRTADHIHSQALHDFSLYMLSAGYAKPPYIAVANNPHCKYRAIMSLLDGAAYGTPGTPVAASGAHYYPSIQAAIARENANDIAGLFVSAKGGHNAESHNHNDIGNYIVYLNGEPGIVDAGVGVYTAKTFGPQRYEIWTMNSNHHNTAIINGCAQMPGMAYAPSDVAYHDDGAVMRFSMDMAGAYGAPAHVTRFIRQFVYDRAARRLTITDNMNLSEVTEPATLPLMTCAEPDLSESGKIRLKLQTGVLVIAYDAGMFSAQYTGLDIREDERLYGAWRKNELYRILLRRKACMANDAWTLAVTVE